MKHIIICAVFASLAATPVLAERGPQKANIPAALQAVRESLLDPSSAQFRSVRQMPNGAVCGEVNGKNRMGGYVGFQPFAADLAKQVVNLQTSQNHATNDSSSREMKINAICDRQYNESIKDAQLRHMNTYMATVENNTSKYCQEDPSSFQCTPSWRHMMETETRTGMTVYIQ
jgi:hypothetical protein